MSITGDIQEETIGNEGKTESIRHDTFLSLCVQKCRGRFHEKSTVSASDVYTEILLLYKIPQKHCDGFNYFFDTDIFHIFIHINSILTYAIFSKTPLYRCTIVTSNPGHPKSEDFSFPNKFLILTPSVLSVS